MFPFTHITDEQRAAFLLALEKSDVALDDWETRFLHSFLVQRRCAWFTAVRRVSTDKLWNKHGSLIGLPVPTRKTK